MYGAILGDIIGEPYERNPIKTKDFPLFSKKPRFTDDSVMAVAIADGILKAGLEADESAMKNAMIDAMHKWGKTYPNAGYGGTFIQWFYYGLREPYGSWTYRSDWLDNR